jgi:hypothetical protein
MLMLTASWFCGAQDAENATVARRNDPLKSYARPSLTVIYVNRGEALSDRLIRQMETNGISGKFNDNTVEKNVLKQPAGQELTVEQLEALLRTQVSKEIVKRWYPYDPATKTHSLDVVAERGIYNATALEAERAAGTARQHAALEASGLELISRSYIIVYDFYNTKRVSDAESNGYEADCDVYLFHLLWTPETEAAFDQAWNEYEGKEGDFIDRMEFPVAHIASFRKAPMLTKVRATKGKNSKTTDEALFLDLTKDIERRAEVYLTKANEDFKVKTEVFAVSPVLARIGTKEGVTVDQRYFVYEIRQDEAGEQTAKRKGVVRASSAIARNETVAAAGEESPTTRFYQTYGKKLEPGMLMQQKPDWGIGVSVFGGTDLNILAELSVGMWAGSLAKNSKIPGGTKIYLKYAKPLQGMEVEGVKLVDSDTDKELRFEILSVGLSKDFYFARYFALTPYVGYASMLTPEDYKESVKEMKKATDGLDIGLNLSFAALHNVQFLGNAGFNTVRGGWYAGGFTAGAGLRIQF